MKKLISVFILSAFAITVSFAQTTSSTVVKPTTSTTAQAPKQVLQTATVSTSPTSVSTTPTATSTTPSTTTSTTTQTACQKQCGGTGTCCHGSSDCSKNTTAAPPKK